MITVPSTAPLRLQGAKKEPLASIIDILDILPLKVRLAEDGGRIAYTDASSVSETDPSDIDEDLAAEPRRVGHLCLPPGLGPPPGLRLEVADGLECLGGAAALAGRTPLHGGAAAYSPLSSCAEAFVHRSLARAGGPRPRLGGAGPKATQWTTVMMRNLPFSYTCDSLIALLESKGFSGWFDFVYVPIKRAEAEGVGYGFVNLTSPERAEKFMLAWEGFDDWPSASSQKACCVQRSMYQGLKENIHRYRNSPFMRDDVPAFYKPVLLKGGVRVPFPRPTKPLRTMRQRGARNEQLEGQEGEH